MVDYRSLARELLTAAAGMRGAHPKADLGDSMRGMPGVMMELSCADGGLAPGELARRTGLSDARIANIVNALEERGWAERLRSTTDRRRVTVSITQAGLDEVHARQEELERHVAEFLRRMGEDDAREVVRLLGKSAEVLGEMCQDREACGPTAEGKANS